MIDQVPQERSTKAAEHRDAKTPTRPKLVLDMGEGSRLQGFMLNGSR